MMIVEKLRPTAYKVSSRVGSANPVGPARTQGLVIHGYGSNKEEILGLAVGLACRIDMDLIVFDLPGHGYSQEVLTLDRCLYAVTEVLSMLDEPLFFVGHSLGAHLGLMTDLPAGVAMSLPGEAQFDGGRAEQLRTLRAKRVLETSPYAGLNEILGTAVEPAAQMLLLIADNELRSAKDLASAWNNRGIESHRITGSNHLDIVSSPSATRIICDWLTEHVS